MFAQERVTQRKSKRKKNAFGKLAEKGESNARRNTQPTVAHNIERWASSVLIGCFKS